MRLEIWLCAALLLLTSGWGPCVSAPPREGATTYGDESAGEALEQYQVETENAEADL